MKKLGAKLLVLTMLDKFFAIIFLKNLRKIVKNTPLRLPIVQNLSFFIGWDACGGGVFKRGRIGQKNRRRTACCRPPLEVSIMKKLLHF